MKKLLLALFTLTLTACSHHKEAANVVRVGTISGPETQLMEVAKKVALQKFGLHVKIITFTDYTVPNQALEDREIDANAFQHYPFLLSQIRARGYSFVPVGDTFLYPMGLYSESVKKLSDLAVGAKIAIPNDPSNEARALLLLQKAGLITLKQNATINATIQDVESNPKHLKLISLDAAQLPRVLEDVAIAAINTNYAVPAGLSPSHALFAEQSDSPYMNIIVARAADKNETKIKELVEAYQSAPVLADAKKLFGDAAIAGFTIKQ
ncbi:MAG: MetQ/NlpA family ABC transporter substrate-binding protein [Gammaproteobacteria bacterium]|nr:MetQ/NlpA family ABC transporter substrate-binding protein [Gammaproteobacteria bacterium]